jgi:hypothetical protein
MTDLTVPKTILEQLGGDDFIALTGATAFISTEDSLTFRAGRNPNSVSHVRITLTATDLYAVTFFHTGRAPRIVDEVCCDILQDVFFKHTGNSRREWIELIIAAVLLLLLIVRHQSF